MDNEIVKQIMAMNAAGLHVTFQPPDAPDEIRLLVERPGNWLKPADRCEGKLNVVQARLTKEGVGYEIARALRTMQKTF